MCRARWDRGGRRCNGETKYFVNQEAHDHFRSDTEQERHFFKPGHLCSMKPDAVRKRRSRARKYAAEVEAIRVVNGVEPTAPIGPVLREELWDARYRGAAVSYLVLAKRLQSIATDEGKTVEEVADRFQKTTVRPSRMDAGQRLHDLVAERPDWIDPDHLVRMIAPADNGSPNPAYCRIVRDTEGREWALTSSYDGSEPMVWPGDEAGLKAAAWEALERVRAVNENPDAYNIWLADNEARTSQTWAPWEQSMSDGDFLAHSTEMHLV